MGGRVAASLGGSEGSEPGGPHQQQHSGVRGLQGRFGAPLLPLESPPSGNFAGCRDLMTPENPHSGPPHCQTDSSERSGEGVKSEQEAPQYLNEYTHRQTIERRRLCDGTAPRSSQNSWASRAVLNNIPAQDTPPSLTHPVPATSSKGLRGSIQGSMSQAGNSFASGWEKHQHTEVREDSSSGPPCS